MIDNETQTTRLITKWPKLVKVYEDEWLRGVAKSGTLCRNRGPDKGKKCCLGFGCLNAGVPLNKIKGKKMPSDIETHELVIRNSFSKADRFFCLAAQLNDNNKINDRTRKAQLKELAQKYGSNFRFFKTRPKKDR
jgi:hypothetical protein